MKNGQNSVARHVWMLGRGVAVSRSRNGVDKGSGACWRSHRCAAGHSGAEVQHKSGGRCMSQQASNRSLVWLLHVSQAFNTSLVVIRSQTSVQYKSSGSCKSTKLPTYPPAPPAPQQPPGVFLTLLYAWGMDFQPKNLAPERAEEKGHPCVNFSHCPTPSFTTLQSHSEGGLG